MLWRNWIYGERNSQCNGSNRTQCSYGIIYLIFYEHGSYLEKKDDIYEFPFPVALQWGEVTELQIEMYFEFIRIGIINLKVCPFSFCLLLKIFHALDH